MLREASGGFSWQLEIIQRYVKGRRNDENDNIHIVLNSANDLQRNGIMFFFSMATADKAFKGYETLDDLMRARLPRGRDSWTLEWKEDACERPVLRMAYVNGVHKTRGLTFAALRDQTSLAAYHLAQTSFVSVTPMPGGHGLFVESLRSSSGVSCAHVSFDPSI
ncbi:hypothetical protein V501_02245 [Pseudogymnoascus sp. VKM F-4519 (FW-2642)]|nr:hypothetical protein V501_02245 [Pseudogymnoascus sp. VKM F-4519 (FW-2642)]